MLLLCASLQRQVFEDENKAAVRLMAGDNVEICRDLDAASFSVHNPVPDFIHCRYTQHVLNLQAHASTLISIRELQMFSRLKRVEKLKAINNVSVEQW